MASLCAVIKSVVTKSGTVCVECRKQHCLLFGFFVGSAVMIVDENTVFSSSQNRGCLLSMIVIYLAGARAEAGTSHLYRLKTNLKVNCKIIFFVVH